MTEAQEWRTARSAKQSCGSSGPFTYADAQRKVEFAEQFGGDGPGGCRAADRPIVE